MAHSRAWVVEAIRKIEADYNRSADTHLIRLDIPGGTLDLLVPDDELARRRKDWTPPAPRIDYGWLARYAAMATSANTGAVLDPNRPE